VFFAVSKPRERAGVRVGDAGVKNRPIAVGRFLLLSPGVPISISHDPDQSNHKRSLLRKKEDNNQANDDFEDRCDVQFELPFVTKKPPVVGRLTLLSLSRCGYFTLTAAIPTVSWSLRIRTEIITIRTRVVRTFCMIYLRFRPIIGHFKYKSRAKRCKSVMFTKY